MQRWGRYVPESMRHPGTMLPDIAARTIATYTAPGELGIDPMCGIGTTLVEAAHLDRYAVGVEYEERWARLAVANLGHARKQGASGFGRAVAGDPGASPDCRRIWPGGRRWCSPHPYGAATHGHIRS
ncbi:TRM11 family SAM-dependent methyltransferase [Nonomuraea sp. KM88]|uniref:TRM11 family SAM-dependent methyltransferase n=1 Tax=Nonomuraea sp. KM88 TaxID=3457427 RepID=UPI003FCE9448